MPKARFQLGYGCFPALWLTCRLPVAVKRSFHADSSACLATCANSRLRVPLQRWRTLDGAEIDEIIWDVETRKSLAKDRKRRADWWTPNWGPVDKTGSSTTPSTFCGAMGTFESCRRWSASKRCRTFSVRTILSCRCLLRSSDRRWAGDVRARRQAELGRHHFQKRKCTLSLRSQ
jgi:hypothetical protein